MRYLCADNYVGLPRTILVFTSLIGRNCLCAVTYLLSEAVVEFMFGDVVDECNYAKRTLRITSQLGIALICSCICDGLDRAVYWALLGR